MKFNVLTGKRVLGIADAKDYAAWAEPFLYKDNSSDNLAILASLGLEREPDSEEVELYFQKSLQDIGLTLPTDNEALKNYAIHLCEQIINGEIPSSLVIDILSGFYSKSDYKAIYSIWDELSEDIWMVQTNEGCIFNTNLNKDNIDDYIKDVSAQFIELLKFDLPQDFFHLSACPKCGYIGQSESEVIEKPWMPKKIFKLIYNRGQMQRSICPKCKAPFPKNMSDYEGRRQYLSQLYKHNHEEKSF